MHAERFDESDHQVADDMKKGIIGDVRRAVGEAVAA
jgi:hypothetical protein